MNRVTGPGCGIILLLAACATPGTPVPSVYEDEHRVVGLQAVPDGHHGNPFSHPASLTEDDVAGVLRGLYIEAQDAPFSRLLSGGEAAHRRRVFSQKEIAFFAPLFVKGLEQAKPDEVVTFYETAGISDRYELTTSGGIFIQGNTMHIILSNHGVRTEVWQDNEQYRAPIRTWPLDPIAPVPGRLVFIPEAYMAPSQEGFFTTLTGARQRRVGVKFREIR